MSKEEQIKKIAQVICSNCNDRCECIREEKPCKNVLADAEQIYEAVYSVPGENIGLTLATNDSETIQRMLGKIEGVAFVIDDKFASPILDAIEVIDCILTKCKKGGEPDA